MSDHKKEAKAASAAKMQRMGLKLEDGSSSFTDERGGSPFEGLNSGNAGKMPITPSRFKRGGKVAHVHGAKAHKNLGKAPRKAAGGPLPHPGQRREPVPMPPTRSVADEYAAYHPDETSDLGSKTTGYARGGHMGRKQAAAIAYKKQGAGMSSKMSVPKGGGIGSISMSPATSMGLMPRKSGGAAKHPDVAEDRKLVKQMVKPQALKHRAHKMGGGAMSRYMDAARENLAANRKWKDQQNLGNLKSMLAGSPSRPYSPRDIMDTEQTIGKREKGIRMAADKLSGKANVPATRDEPMKKGGRAHKMGGGAMSRYMDAARENLAANKKYKDQQLLTNFRFKMNGLSQPHSRADIMDTNRTMSKRERGIRMATNKLSGNANVPATNDEEMKKGGRVEKCWGGETKARPHRATGGRTKGKTNVNIIISPQSGGQGQGLLGAGVGMGQPPVPPMMPPMPPQMPPMPQGGGMPPMPPGAGGGLPPQLMAALAAKGGAGMPPMGRKTGGRVGNKMPKYQEKDYGSGSGLGRLEKRKWPVADGTE